MATKTSAETLKGLFAGEGFGHLGSIGMADFDVVAEHLVVAHLESADTGLLDQLLLIPGEEGIAITLQTARFIQLSVRPVAEQSTGAQM